MQRRFKFVLKPSFISYFSYLDSSFHLLVLPMGCLSPYCDVSVHMLEQLMKLHVLSSHHFSMSAMHSRSSSKKNIFSVCKGISCIIVH